MTYPTQTIIFDFGNVLFNWEPQRIFQRFFPGGTPEIDAFFSEVGFKEWHSHQDLGRSYAEAVAERSAQFPQYAHIFRGYDIFWGDSIVGPIEGTVAILRRLKQAGYPLYGLSNYSAEKFRLDRLNFEFYDWFKDIVVSGEVGLVKPDPAIFHLLLTRIGRAAQECLFIDDSNANVAAARRLGFTAIQFRSPAQLEQELRTLDIL